jgi:hypothetical protein
MNFGMVTDEATSFEIMGEALKQGVILFDTADVYGGPQKPEFERVMACPRRSSDGGSPRVDDVSTSFMPPRYSNRWTLGRMTASSPPITYGRLVKTAFAV